MTPNSTSKQVAQRRSSCTDLALLALTLLTVAAFAVNTASAFGSVVVAEPAIDGLTGSVHQAVGLGEHETFFWTETQGIEHAERNAARWEATLTAGDFRVEVWLPKEFGYTWARYSITRGAETTEVRLRQANFGGEWVTLGTWEFPAGLALIRSTDAAGYPNEELAWADLRFTQVSALPSNIETIEGSMVIDEPEVAGSEESIGRFAGVGWAGEMLRVYAQGTERPALDTATWSAPVLPGEYEVSLYVPSEHNEAAISMTVEGLGGSKTSHVDEAKYKAAWVSLGVAEFGPAGAIVTSNDSTGVPGEEIGWSAVSLRPLRLTPPTADPSKPLPKPIEAAPTISAPEARKTPAPKAFSPLQSKLVHFEFLRTRHAASADGYRVGYFRPSSKDLVLAFRCHPCKFLSIGRSASSRPRTLSSYAKGPAQRIVKRPFYKGTVLEITVGGSAYATRGYMYRFPGHRQILGPELCPSTAATEKACPA